LPKETVYESARVCRAWKEAAIQAFYHELPFSNKNIDLMRSNLNLNQNIQGQPLPYGKFVKVPGKSSLWKEVDLLRNVFQKELPTFLST
jgi:hypothetical protein